MQRILRHIVRPRLFFRPLIPRLRIQNIMYILNLLIPPNFPMNTLPPHRLQRIVDIRKHDPARGEEVSEEGLVGEIVGGG